MCGSSLEPAHVAHGLQAGRTTRPEGGPVRAGLGSELKDPVSQSSRLQDLPAWVESVS